jgi:hypothetical protein
VSFAASPVIFNMTTAVSSKTKPFPENNKRLIKTQSILKSDSTNVQTKTQQGQLVQQAQKTSQKSLQQVQQKQAHPQTVTLYRGTSTPLVGFPRNGSTAKVFLQTQSTVNASTVLDASMSCGNDNSNTKNVSASPLFPHLPAHFSTPGGSALAAAALQSFRPSAWRQRRRRPEDVDENQSTALCVKPQQISPPR